MTHRKLFQWFLVGLVFMCWKIIHLSFFDQLVTHSLWFVQKVSQFHRKLLTHTVIFSSKATSSNRWSYSYHSAYLIQSLRLWNQNFDGMGANEDNIHPHLHPYCFRKLKIIEKNGMPSNTVMSETFTRWISLE